MKGLKRTIVKSKTTLNLHNRINNNNNKVYAKDIFIL